MVEARIRLAEDDQQNTLQWDSTWDQEKLYADWTLEPVGNAANPGGLTARSPLNTAILISLFTDRRIETYEPNPTDSSDHRGWWGDGVDLEANEQPLGSKLWTLYRSALTDDLAVKARDYAHEALMPVVRQGAVAHFDIQASVDRQRAALTLEVVAYGQTGLRVYEQRFTRLWQQEIG